MIAKYHQVSNIINGMYRAIILTLKEHIDSKVIIRQINERFI